ncbi:MAG: hypothetical protein EKK62_09625 [Acidimicrobiia bacterium]|nr:MAG: hypothetical protein EKK62_09625 [Acidimicrobiia bacterium]
MRGRVVEAAPSLMSEERQLRGGSAEAFRSTADRFVIEGPAGTGKTSGLLLKALHNAETWPGSRGLFLRRTRKSLNETVLVEWETVILGQGHPMRNGTATRSHRESYVHPNGSEIVLGGTDHPERYMSGQYDWVMGFEATEMLPEQIETVLTRLRNGVMPYQQLMLDCNPDRRGHWINRRAAQGWMQRILSRHHDNPRLFNHTKNEWTPFGVQYLSRVLGALTGPRRERLLLGHWVTAEGLIWETYDAAIHRVANWDIKLDPKGRRFVKLHGDWHRIKRVIGGLDFGFRAPGSFQILAVTEEGLRVRVAEAYHTGQLIEWWADRLNEVRHQWGLDRVYCDPENAEGIRRLNTLLVDQTKRGAPALCVTANNTVVSRFKGDISGLDIVRDLYKHNQLFLLDDVMFGGIDAEVRAAHQPWCLHEEQEGYVWEEYDEGDAVPERPKPGIPDHACDGLRYAAAGTMDTDGDNNPPDEPPPVLPGTYAEIFGTPESLERERLQRQSAGRWAKR